MYPLWYKALIIPLMANAVFGVDPLHSVLTTTVNSVLQGVEIRLATQTADIERRMTERMAQLEARLAERTKAMTETLNEAQLEAFERRLTALCSPQDTRQFISSVLNASNEQLQILKVLEDRVPLTFLRRVDGSVNFTRDWGAYKHGFGEERAEFWLGLEKLHQLTTRHQYGLRADMEDWSGDHKWAEYRSFRVRSETHNYALAVSGYNPNSTAGNGMSYHNGNAFSTIDRDNDKHENSCAKRDKGGWWYNMCQAINPTGLYKPEGYRGWDGVRWLYAYGDDRSFKSMSLKMIRN